MAGVILQRRLETVNLRNCTLVACARQAFRSFVRAYATHSADTKAIFKVSSLHLGHIAKNFALGEAPTHLHQQNAEDTLGRVANGYFSKKRAQERADARRRARQEKFAVSRSKAKTGKPGGHGEKGRSRALNSEWGAEGGSTGKGNHTQKYDRVKLKSMGKAGKKKFVPSASGKFRKSDGGYFKRKMHGQATSEFSA